MSVWIFTIIGWVVVFMLARRIYKLKGQNEQLQKDYTDICDSIARHFHQSQGRA
jgi:preprotein translocase subunit Sec63